MEITFKQITNSYNFILIINNLEKEGKYGNNI